MKKPTRRVVATGPRGFFSYVFQALSHYNVQDGFQYYIDFRTTPYNDPVRGSNMWNYYFDQGVDQPAEDVESNVWFHPYIVPQRLTVEDRKNFQNLIQRHISIKPEIMSKAQEFFKANFKGKRVLGIHRRGTDHITDGPVFPIERFFEEVARMADQFEYIFIMSDEQQAVDAFKCQYSNCISYDSIRSNDGRAIHHYMGSGKKDPYKMGENVLVESISLSMCNHIIKTVSGVSDFSTMLNPELTYTEIDKGIIYG